MDKKFKDKNGILNGYHNFPQFYQIFSISYWYDYYRVKKEL